MAYNTKFNVQDAIADLYPTHKRAALFSIVGSINATLITAADRIVQQFEADGIEFKEFSAKEVVDMLHGPTTSPSAGDMLSEMKHLFGLAYCLREELRFIDPNDSDDTPEAQRVGSIYGTLEMMTGKQKLRPVNSQAVEQLKLLNIELSAEQIAEARAKTQSLDQARADQRAKRRGGIEWVLDHLFDDPNLNEANDYWSNLPRERKEQLTQKLVASLNNAITQAQNNALFGRSGDHMLGICDIPMLRDATSRVMYAAYPPNPPKAEKPKSVRKVKKSDVQATKTDETVPAAS